MQAGAFIFRLALQKRSFASLDINADFNDEIPEPMTGGKVSSKLQSILGFTDEWAKSPDYQRVHSNTQSPFIMTQPYSTLILIAAFHGRMSNFGTFFTEV